MTLLLVDNCGQKELTGQKCSPKHVDYNYITILKIHISFAFYFHHTVNGEAREIQLWIANSKGSSYISLAVHGQSLYRWVNSFSLILRFMNIFFFLTWITMRNQHCTHPTVDSILIYILQLPRYPAPTNQPIAKSQSELQNQYMIAFAYNLHSATMNVSQMREKKTRFLATSYTSTPGITIIIPRIVR